MQNTGRNPTQPQRKDMAARNPAKIPAAGTAGPATATQTGEAGSTGTPRDATPRDVRDMTPRPGVARAATREADPLAGASRRILSVEVAGTAASGNTIDADGKTLEAHREIGGRHDNIVTSNATPENHVPVQADGLGGFDSRFVGAVPMIRTLPGYRVRGYVSVEDQGGRRHDVIISLERDA